MPTTICGSDARADRPKRRTASVLMMAACFGVLALAPAWAGEIHQAVEAGDQARVALLLRQDPSLVRSRNENSTRDLPLHTAAITGQLEIARLLLESGAELDGLDSDESTPLQCAAVYRHPEVVRLLLARGADVNRRDKNGAYSLSFAASGGDSACVRLVFDAGADLNLITPQGTNLLHYACTRGFWWLADRVIAAGGDINRGDREGQTPLHMASFGRFPERVREIIARGGNVTAADSEGVTPLHAAAMYDRVEIARLLLEHGADANAVDRRGATPLLWACRGGAPSLARLLLDQGARPDVATDWGATPLLAAAENGNREVVDMLLQAGAELEMPNRELGLTPLHVAALLGYGDVVESLLSKGADANQRDLAGHSPLDTALKYGHGGVADLLAARGGTATMDAVPAAPFALPKPGAEEAYVWSLGHSGWAVKTKHHLLIFDYAPVGRVPDQPSLQNGAVNPLEIAGQDVAVFASHEHGDHYNPVIFDWRTQLPQARVFLGFQPRPVAPAPGQPPARPQPADYELLPPGQVREIDGMKITTIESNDSGVGFVVEVDGVTVFHAGDHANRYRDLSGPFKPQIERLAQEKIHPDLAFLPVSGCNFGDQVAVRIGVEYQLTRLQPNVFFPMHGGVFGTRLRQFVEELGDGFPATEKAAAESKGDCFHYRNGRLL